eukprot:m51a1_g6770 hypothetical protein (613) ;mRNA; f:108544-111453
MATVPPVDEKKQLKQKFPELSMSVIDPIFDQFGPGAEEVLKNLQRDPTEDEKVRGIAEMLPHLSEEHVRAVLREHHGDAEATTMALLAPPQHPGPAASAAAAAGAKQPSKVTDSVARAHSPPVGSDEWARIRMREEAERKKRADEERKKREAVRKSRAEADRAWGAGSPATSAIGGSKTAEAEKYEKAQREMSTRLKQLEERESKLSEALAEAQSRLSSEGQRRVDATLADAHRIEVMRRELEGMRAERDKAARMQDDLATAQQKLEESARKAAQEATAQAMQTALLAKELEEARKQRDEALAQRERALEEAERAATAARALAPSALVASVAPDDANAVLATWNIPETAGCPTPSDWIAIYIHNREFKYTAYAQTKGERKGSYKFAGLSKGYYDVRYFYGNAPTYSFHTEPVLIGPAVGGLRGEYARRRVAVSWAAPAGKGDWVGLYRASTRSNRQYLAYRNVDGLTAADFEAPREPGRYEVRYFFSGPGILAGGFLPFSGRVAVEVPLEDKLEASLEAGEGKVVVRWACPSRGHSSRDWVGLYAQGAESTAYLASAYTADGAFAESTSTDAGVVEIDLSKVRNRDAVSEVRYFSAATGRYTPLMRAPVKLT